MGRQPTHHVHGSWGEDSSRHAFWRKAERAWARATAIYSSIFRAPLLPLFSNFKWTVKLGTVDAGTPKATSFVEQLVAHAPVEGFDIAVLHCLPDAI